MKLTNEGRYCLTCREHLQMGLLWIALCTAVGWLFYDTILYSVAGWPGYLLFFPKVSALKVNKYQKQMRLEFTDVMISIYSSLSAGATVEQSLRRAWEDMERILKPESRMLLELEFVCRKMEHNIPTAQCLEEMAERCRDTEIENFTQILVLGKRQGGKLAMLVRDSVEKIQQRIETTYEIEGLIGAKRNEFLFMCMIPAGIIVYMRLFSPEFMSVLYGNPVGAALMTLCLFVYIGAFCMGLKILQLNKE